MSAHFCQSVACDRCAVFAAAMGASRGHVALRHLADCDALDTGGRSEGLA